MHRSRDFCLHLQEIHRLLEAHTKTNFISFIFKEIEYISFWCIFSDFVHFVNG